MSRLAANKIAGDINEAAAATGLSRTFLNAAIADGRLPAKMSTPRGKDAVRGGKRLIKWSDLQAFIDSLEDA